MKICPLVSSLGGGRGARTNTCAKALELTTLYKVRNLG